jgi:hypothetical protein
MLEKISGNFGNFSLLGKVINADFYHFCPKYVGHSEKSGCLKFIGIWEFSFCSIITSTL